jgi:hypothetical protein
MEWRRQKGQNEAVEEREKRGSPTLSDSGELRGAGWARLLKVLNVTGELAVPENSRHQHHCRISFEYSKKVASNR